MIIKPKILVLIALTYAMVGCGEDYISGVTKGGTGSGAPPDRDNTPIQSVIGEKLKDQYLVSFSGPVSDDCYGIKRTLYFNHPFGNHKILEPEDVLIKASDGLDYQISAQMMWENQSLENKKLIKLKDYILLDLQDVEQEINVGSISFNSLLDMHQPYTEINMLPNEIYFSEKHNFNLVFSSINQITHNSVVVKILEKDTPQVCEPLSISFSIFNTE